MKKTLTLFAILLLGFNILGAQDKINFIRIGESNPSTSAYVFGSGEQLSGQQFQTDGILTYEGYQYTVYYNQTRNVCIARRKLPLGKWEEIKLPYQNAVDDAHNTISMGICHKDGSIHLSYDHHNSDLHYCYSLSTAGSANDPENMIWEAASFSTTTDVMDKAVPNVTYPRFISKPDGNLLFECRYRWSGFGDSYLREYDGDTKKWTLIGRYVQGEDVTPDACAYINGMTYDDQNRLHVTWCWRDDFGGGTNHDFYYAYSEDHGRTWKDTFGNQNAVTENFDPIENKTTGMCLGQTKKTFMIEEIPYNKGYINQETQAVDSKGRIHAVNSQIPGSGTDSNWGSSRTKARLHHRFRDVDGTWKTVMVKNNGETVNSYCRTNLSFDAFDNAFVIANGAEVYYATDANGYDDWNLMSDTDKARFLSEPLVDRPLLHDSGVLSFAYLGADNKITVIDYLLDNPHTPSGSGLTAECFSDDKFSKLISTSSDSKVGSEAVSAGAKSIRWSGTFETTYAENYTLYLNTTAETSVYVDGVKVLLTRSYPAAKEYSFTFAPIASHKHNIIIESKATTTDIFALSWSSHSVNKVSIPMAALYSDMAHDVPTGDDGNEPDLMRKEVLSEMLSGAQIITGKNTINIPSFNPQGDYTLELNAKIISSTGCGLVLEGRSKTGKGIRISLDETSLNWIAPYSKSKLLTVADNSENQIYRLAVSKEKAHIYQGEKYITTVDVAEIGDINNEGEEEQPSPQITDLNILWAGPTNTGSGTPTEYGWDNAVSGIGWSVANGGSGVRYLDVISGHTYNGNTYKGRILTVRWDGGQGAYSYPITLEANASYEFSMLYEWWNNGTPSSISVGVGTTKNAADSYEVKSFPTASKNVLQKAVFNFTSKEAGTYYLIFNGQGGVMYGIADLALKKQSYQSKLTLSKYCEGASDIQVNNIMYQDGAYAPGPEKPDVDLAEKETLSQKLTDNIQLAGLDGSKDVSKLPFDLSGDYSVEIAATIASSQGRGMDLEVRDEQGLGFRTALNDIEFSWIAPFAQAQIMSASKAEEQIMRYAIKDNKIYVFQNGKYVTSFTKQVIGDMDDLGTTEKEPYSNTPIASTSNMVVNPDFQKTPDNGAPEGWTSNGDLGVAGGARVQQKSSTTELSAYPDGTKAFLVRFDGSYSWFANAVSLQADIWYEYSFDLITWGNNASKTLSIVVSDTPAGDGNTIFSQQLTTPSIRAIGERNVIRFKSKTTGTYYITFSKKGTLAGTLGLTNLCLAEYAINGLLVGKNYSQGKSPISIRYISVDPDGAFAPYSLPSGIQSGEEASIISICTQGSQLIVEGSKNMGNVNISDLSGRIVLNKRNCGQHFVTHLSSGIYLVSVTSSDGEQIVRKAIIY